MNIAQHQHMEGSREMSKEEEVTTPLLTRKSEEESNNGGVEIESIFIQELKKMSFTAAPMVAVTVSQYLLQVVSLMMVGHLGILVSLSGVAIAMSFAEVTGFSVLVNSFSLLSLSLSLFVLYIHIHFSAKMLYVCIF